MFSVFILFMISCRCTILDVKFSFLYATVHSGENAIFNNVNRWVDKYVIMRRQCKLRTDCRKNTKFNNCVTHTKQLFKIQGGFEQNPLQYFFCFVCFSLGCFAFYLPLIFPPLSSFWFLFIYWGPTFGLISSVLFSSYVNAQTSLKWVLRSWVFLSKTVFINKFPTLSPNKVCKEETFWSGILKGTRMNLFNNYLPFNEERAWSYLTPSYINMALNPFQSNPCGICCLLSRVFSFRNLISNFMYKCYIICIIWLNARDKFSHGDRNVQK